MDVDLASEVLLELMQKEIFEIVFAGQIGGKPQEGDAANQQKGNQGNRKSKS